MEPEVKVVLTGTIKDFARIDNVYTSLKREGSKLLDSWKIDIEVTFSETEKPGTQE